MCNWAELVGRRCKDRMGVYGEGMMILAVLRGLSIKEGRVLRQAGTLSKK